MDTDDPETESGDLRPDADATQLHGPGTDGAAKEPGGPDADGAATGPGGPDDAPAEEGAAGVVRPVLAVAKVLTVVAAVVGVLVVAGLKFGAGAALADLLRPDPVAEAEAGDCLTELPQVSGTEERTVRDVAVVDCGSADAAYTVAGRVDDQTQEQARSGRACEQFVQPDEDGYVFYNIAPGEKGYLLCLTRRT
ncbi:LppU/SCO3897 family protein [Micromonospora citrea]|uniref:LppU/SCO3897 family protein n=1 Tax=Micromonospora citrea TaxID=47855 RepID=UPI003C48B85B